MWARLKAIAAAGPDPAPASSRPAALRCLLLEEGGSSSTSDYLLMPRLQALGLPVVRADARRAPDAADLRPGDLVVVSRYVPPRWRGPLARRARELAGLVYFMDDDLLDTAAHARLAAPYAKKLATLASSQRRWLEAHVDAFWVSTPALAAKYASLRPILVPLAPPARLLQGHAAVHVVYHGTASHGAEIDWLRAVVEGLQARCTQTHFSLFGDHAVNRLYRDLPRVSILHPMAWANYLAYTAGHPADIGLAPLLPTPFNAARGAVKFYDYARMGAVGIYSDVEPYRGFVRDGVDGVLLPLEPGRWIDTIAELADPASQRLALLRQGVRARLESSGG